MKKTILFFSFLLLLAKATFAQNVGIGTTTPTKAGLVVNNKVGNVHAIFGDNTSGVSIESAWPGIHFNDYYNGNRRALATGYTAGVELNPANGTLYIYTTPAATPTGSVITSQTAINIAKNGYTAIGNIAPTEKLDVDGFVQSRGLKIWQNNYIELGAGIAGKEVNAGKIGYSIFSNDAVDMVGASVGGSARRIRFWAEGGSRFEGPINVSNINSFTGLAKDNININANTTTTGFSKLGTSSMGLKTMTFVVPIAKQTNGVGGSWASAVVTNIPVLVKNIVSFTGLSIIQYDNGNQSAFPLVGDATSSETGKGKMSMSTIVTGGTTTYASVRYDDCDLCDKGAKFVLHITYTEQDLLP